MDMTFFTEVPGVKVLISQAGGLRFCSVYAYQGLAYAQMGSYYHPLTSNNGVTGKRGARWIEFQGEKAHLLDWQGKTHVRVREDRAPVTLVA